MFLPENIDFTKSHTYILSIRLTPSGFYFSIHCPTDSTVFYQNSITFKSSETYLKNIEKLIFDYSFFTYDFKRINVIQVNDKLTIVPNEYYDKRFEPSLLSFNVQSPTKKVLSNGIDKLDCKVIWDIDESHHNFLSRSLLNPRFTNHLSILIPFYYQLHNKANSTLFINFNDDNMIDAVAFSGEELFFAKTFVATNPLEDRYFIQKTWEVLKLDAQNDKLFFSGETVNHDTCIDMIKKLIPNSKNISIVLSKDLKINHSEIPTEILSQLCV